MKSKKNRKGSDKSVDRNVSEIPLDRKQARYENKKRKLKAFLDLVEKPKKVDDLASDQQLDNGQPKNYKHNSMKESITECVVELDAAPSGKRPRLPDAEYLLLKKRLKEREAGQMLQPKFFLTTIGESSKLNVTSRQKSPLFMSDVQSLLLFSLVGNTAPYKPRWCQLLRCSKLSHRIVVLVEGVGLNDLLPSNVTGNELPGVTSDVARTFPRIAPLFPYQMELFSPSQYSTSAAEEILNVPLSMTAREKLCKEFGSLEKAEGSGKIYKSLAAIFPIADENGIKEESCSELSTSVEIKTDSTKTSDQFDRRLLLLGPSDLLANDFPIQLEGAVGADDPLFKLSRPQYAKVTKRSPMFGVDCEMCLTITKQLELTSVSVVNEKLQLVYHSLVLPYNRITNYLTRFSGITKEMMESVTTRVEDVQKELRHLLPPDAILVGHSLNGDLKVLKLFHPYVMDSSIAYNLTGKRGMKSSLKMLTKIFLNKEIQTHISGHDPTEDASASLELIQLKLRHEPSFGDVILGGQTPLNYCCGVVYDVEDDQGESTNAVKDKQPAIKYNTSLFQHARQKLLRCTLLTTPVGMSEYEGLLQGVGADLCTEVVEGNKRLSVRSAQVAIETDLAIVHMKMSIDLEQNNPRINWHKFQKLDKRLRRIYRCCASKSLIMIVFTGSTMAVPLDQRTNGFIMLSVKDVTS